MYKTTLRCLALTAFAVCSLAAVAQKSVYIPLEWQHFNPNDTLLYAESDPDNKYTWSKSRSVESDNVIVLWDKSYGSTLPSRTDAPYHVDEQLLLSKCEAFYALEAGTLGFDSKSIDRYKVMVLMHRTTDWICFGGGYDFLVPALWLSPSTCQPIGSAVAHEVGHSFHYMCYSDDSNHGADPSIQTGFHGAVGNGATIWETTANWQALQSFPEEFFTMSYTQHIFPKSHNYAFTHEWQRYQAYPFLSYLCQYYGDLTTVSQVWKQHETVVKDFNQVLMDLKGLTAEQLYRLHFEFALHAVTWDIDAALPYRNGQTGNFEYHYVKTAPKNYQVAYASVPQATGFNVIPLKVPEAAGTTITTTFTALKPGCQLADGDPALYLNGNSEYTTSGRTTYNTGVQASKRGFRLGYVALMDDGTTTYHYDADKIYGTGTETTAETFSMQVPDGTQQLWLVVSPTPSVYIQHRWDENYANDDQWPYAVGFRNTDILGETDKAIVSDDIVTSISQLSGGAYFVLQGKTDQQVLYFQSNERALFGTLTTAQAAVTNGCLFRMEQADGEGDNVFVLQVYDSQLSPFVNWDNNEQAPFYKGKALSLNFNPDASITFCLYNTQRNGRDMVNGGAWTVAYDEEQQAFTLKNVALGKYLTTSGASDTPFYWQLRLVTMEDENENGDVNGDGTVDGSDVECLVAHLLGLQPQDFNEQNADINADDSIDISDVTALIGELAPRSTRNNRKNP